MFEIQPESNKTNNTDIYVCMQFVIVLYKPFIQDTIGYRMDQLEHCRILMCIVNPGSNKHVHHKRFHYVWLSIF